MQPRIAIIVLVLALASGVGSAARADDGQPVNAYRWYLQGGFYYHFRDDDEYGSTPLFASLERLPTSRWVYGFSMFDNSFGQFSQYAYAGRLFRPFERYPNVHLKLTGGIVHGYRGKHHDTLPIRWGDSWGIGVIPTIGYRKGRVGYDVAFLKASAALFLVGWHFD